MNSVWDFLVCFTLILIVVLTLSAFFYRNWFNPGIYLAVIFTNRVKKVHIFLFVNINKNG